MEEKSLNVPLIFASLTPALFWKIVAQTSVRGSTSRPVGEETVCWYIIFLSPFRLIGCIETMFSLRQEFDLFLGKYAIEDRSVFCLFPRWHQC